MALDDGRGRPRPGVGHPRRQSGRPGCGDCRGQDGRSEHPSAVSSPALFSHLALPSPSSGHWSVFDGIRPEAR
ncbi:hypothetical protein T261_05392 [Streptomyces lydicus]|nr:hypothetical protein T261_05392 [Streptomyces lydicus]